VLFIGLKSLNPGLKTIAQIALAKQLNYSQNYFRLCKLLLIQSVKSTYHVMVVIEYGNGFLVVFFVYERKCV